MKYLLKKIPFVQAIRRHQVRRRRALSFYRDKIRLAKNWAYKKSEFSNFYYWITPRNRTDLSFLLSLVLNEPRNKIESYFAEIESDVLVKGVLKNFRDRHPEMADSSLGMGRRIAWYAVVRSVKPRLVVETGVHNGMGALIIAAALSQNHQEGFDGSYIGTDIDSNAGELLCPPYDRYGQIKFGDSIDSLMSLDKNIDVFISDSDHSSEYEYREYLTIANKLNKNAYILGDNSHSSDSLRKFSENTNRQFLFFKEEPLDHFYPGAGIGISFERLFFP